MLLGHLDQFLLQSRHSSSSPSSAPLSGASGPAVLTGSHGVKAVKMKRRLHRLKSQLLPYTDALMHDVVWSESLSKSHRICLAPLLLLNLLFDEGSLALFVLNESRVKTLQTRMSELKKMRTPLTKT